MEIKPTQLDMTNPFAPMQQRMNQVETVLRQMPPAQREQLLSEILPPIPMHRPSPLIEPAVTMVTVKTEEWDGGPVVKQHYPTAIFRPRRIVSTIPIPCQPLAHYDAAVEQRVQQWLASGQLLAWIPILSQENFPNVPPQVLQFADQHPEAMRWPIYRPEGLLALPEGITGWLLPADAEDSDVACGVWNGAVYILGVQDKRTGRKQTLLGERFDIATGQADDPEQSAV